MATYPGALPTFPVHQDGASPTDSSPAAVLTAAEVNNVQAEVVAIAAELGVNPSGAAADVGARLTAIEGAYAPWKAARPGSAVAFLGDSITLGTDDNTTQAQAGSWPNLACMMSGQQMQMVRNAGVAGDTTAAMLARFDTAVTPYAPSAVAIAPGTNDVGVISLATWTGQVQQIVAKARAIGAAPILVTLPPTDSTTPVNRKAEVARFNGWLRRYAAAQGITLWDIFTVLADPATGGYKSAYSVGDGVHPSVAGYAAVAAFVASKVGPIFPPGGPHLCVDDTDLVSSLYKGCFGGYSGSTLPTGWADGAGTPAGSTLSYTTDSLVPGQMVTLTHSAAAGVRQLSYTIYTGNTTVSTAATAGSTTLVTAGRGDRGGALFVGTPGTATYEVVKVVSSSGGGPQTQTLAAPLLYAHSVGEPVVATGIPGDEMIFSGVVTSDGGAQFRIGTSCPGAAYSPQAAFSVTAAMTRAVFYQRFTIPAGTTPSIDLLLQQAAGTGVVKFGQIGLYNATRLGI